MTTQSRTASGEGIRIAAVLHDDGVAMTRARLRREHPLDSDAEIHRRLLDWLATRPGADRGDGEGRPVSLPRP